LNLTPDHLDRHETFAAYVNTKLRLFENQSEEDFAVANFEDAETAKAMGAFDLRSKSVRFHRGQKLAHGCFVENGRIQYRFEQDGFDVLPVADIALPGRHNLSNVLAATATALLAGVPVASVKTALKEFKGLAHRLEFVRDLNGVKYINDSKATNLESMQAGLDSFQRPLILIAGGRAKENDFQRIQKTIGQRVKKMILIKDFQGVVSKKGRDGKQPHGTDQSRECWR